MAKRATIVPAEVKTDVIKELSKVYCVNGNLYRTKTEAKLSLLKADLYQTYLNRSGGTAADRKRMMAHAIKTNFHNVYISIDDAIQVFAEKGATLLKEGDSAAV